jgi:hypothetical protein
MSRRDGAIVAWHEVPGIVPPKESSRRVRSDSCRCGPILAGSGNASLHRVAARTINRTRTFQEESLLVTVRADRSDENGILELPQIYD